MKTKEEIRKEIIENLKKQDEEERKEKSLLIKQKLFSLPEFKEAKVVMLYVSTAFEVDTTEIIDDALEMGKKIVVPYVFKEERKIGPSLIKDRIKDLIEGPYGIYQPSKYSYTPVLPSGIDLVVVPAIAFTREGTRLGRGAGYYDRFLKGLPKETPTIGIAFSQQVVSDLPHNEQDIPVKKLIIA